MINNYTLLCAFGILTAATITDFRTHRIPNKLMLISAVISVIVVVITAGGAGLTNAGLGFLTGFGFYFPLAWFGVIGGGDLKLLAVVGITTGALNILMIGLFSLIWGAIFGVLQSAFRGEIKAVSQNLLHLFLFKKIENKQLHRFPFAASMLMAALTQWSWSKMP
ncbi:MAG: A24 family peptidase [Oligoflexia bacterium]|nr:A24 family peptidase [Oligoflexia bacterium]